MAGENITYVAAFAAGFLTFLSPCLLPLIPSFIAYITGASLADLKDLGKRGEIRKKTILHSLLFILGFSIIFILLGLTATAIGKALFRYQNALRIIGGILIIIFGFHLIGILRFDFLLKERRLKLPAKGGSYLGSFLIGVTFASAWTPCAGPLLGAILGLAGIKASVVEGAKLLTIYSLGIAVPFFITGLAINSFLEYFKKFTKFVSAMNIIGGLFLIIIGILVLTNYLTILSAKLVNPFTK